jgi:cell division protein FtsQ
VNLAAQSPLDVRLMNRAAAALMLAFALLIALMGVRLLARWSAFDLQQIVVTGDSHHSNSATLRANVAPHIAGTSQSLACGVAGTPAGGTVGWRW